MYGHCGTRPRGVEAGVSDMHGGVFAVCRDDVRAGRLQAPESRRSSAPSGSRRGNSTGMRPVIIRVCTPADHIEVPCLPLHPPRSLRSGETGSPPPARHRPSARPPPARTRPAFASRAVESPGRPAADLRLRSRLRRPDHLRDRRVGAARHHQGAGTARHPPSPARTSTRPVPCHPLPPPGRPRRRCPGRHDRRLPRRTRPHRRRPHDTSAPPARRRGRRSRWTAKRCPVPRTEPSATGTCCPPSPTPPPSPWPSGKWEPRPTRQPPSVRCFNHSIWPAPWSPSTPCTASRTRCAGWFRRRRPTTSR
jgi:hypothetical protein